MKVEYANILPLYDGRLWWFALTPAPSLLRVAPHNVFDKA
jgi:hypothetical protein